MRTAHVYIVFSVLIVFLSGNADDVFSQDEMPRDLQRKYTEDLYIVRSGYGDTSEDASESARFEIAKYFEAKISGETLVTQWAKSQTKRGKTIEDRLTEISNTIIIGASRDIPGIEIASSQYDNKSKSYQAWAVLEKSKYISLLQERMRSIDSKVNLQLTNLTGDDLHLIRIYSRIMNDLLLREKAQQDLSLLNSVFPVDSNEIILFGVMTSLDSLIAEAFDVGLVFNGDVNSNVKSGIIKGINDAGIRVREYPDFSTATDSGIDLLMSVEHNVTARKTSKTFNNKEFTFHFADWVLSVQTIDPKTQEIIDTLIQKDNTNGSYEDQAYERMMNKILQDQVPEVSKWVYNSIFKPEEQF